MVQPTLLPAGLVADEIVACIGLIADTHLPQRCAALPESLFTVFAGVDLILHAGDVGELCVLDELSRCAPVIAVHGNDDTRASQRELPYQQVVTVAGQRILLWHSHYVDRIDELESRRSDDLREKLRRSVARGRRAGAPIVVFGHWHIPLLFADEGVVVINPGAIAPGSFVTTQLRKTVALLFLRREGAPLVSHVDLAQPTQIYQPPTAVDAGFRATTALFSASILAPELAAREEELRAQLEAFGFADSLPPFLRAAHRCWSGERDLLTAAALLHEIANDQNLSAKRKGEYSRIVEQVLA